jgi:hypothetical protein
VAGSPVEGTSAVAGTAWAVGCSLAAGRRNSRFGRVEGHMDQVRPWVGQENRTAALGKGRRRRLGGDSSEEVPRVLCRPLLWWCDLVAWVWWVMLWNRGASLRCLLVGKGLVWSAKSVCAGRVMLVVV